MGAKLSPPSWGEIREWFPALRRWCYLNAASMSPVPVPVHEALSRFLDRCRDDDVTLEVHLDHAEGLRAKAAGYLRCHPEELCFVSSTSEGALRAALAPEWRKGENVVVPYASFPAVVLPLGALAEQGMEIRRAGTPGSARVSEEEILGCIDDATRLVCVSWVSFVTGHRIDFEPIAQACRRHGALLYADLMQGAGALRPDLSRLPVDMAAFQPVKWIPSPSGLGIFYCRRDLVTRTRIPHRGWTSVVREGLEGLTDYERSLWPGARRFEVGSVPPLLVAGFESALDLLEQVGPDRIEERVLQLGGELHKMLENIGLRVLTPPEPGRRAGITTFEATKSGPVVAHLRAQGVVVADREGKVRVSTHFYNNVEDLHRLVAALS